MSDEVDEEARRYVRLAHLIHKKILSGLLHGLDDHRHFFVGTAPTPRYNGLWHVKQTDLDSSHNACQSTAKLPCTLRAEARSFNPRTDACASGDKRDTAAFALFGIIDGVGDDMASNCLKFSLREITLLRKAMHTQRHVHLRKLVCDCHIREYRKS